jgi:hypothetical protein
VPSARHGTVRELRRRGGLLRLRVLGVAAVLAVALGGPAPAQSSTYYVYDGRSLQRVDHADPAAVRVKEWRVWLYRKGQRAGGPDYWGAIRGASASSVMAHLERDQVFERYWERWCRCDWGAETHFNPLGPIAIMEPPPGVLESLARLSEDYDRLQELREPFDKAREMLDPDDGRSGGERNPYGAVGSVLKEYTENLKKAQQDLRKLGRLQTVTTAPPLAEISRGLSQIDDALRGLGAQKPRVDAALRALPAPGGPWGRREIAGRSYTVIQSIEPGGEKITVRQSVVGDPSGQGQAYLFSVKSLDRAATRLRPEDGMWIVTLRSSSRNVDLQIRRGDGSVVQEVVSSLELFFRNEEEARAATSALFGK